MHGRYRYVRHSAEDLWALSEDKEVRASFSFWASGHLSYQQIRMYIVRLPLLEYKQCVAIGLITVSKASDYKKFERRKSTPKKRRKVADSVCIDIRLQNMCVSTKKIETFDGCSAIHGKESRYFSKFTKCGVYLFIWKEKNCFADNRET